MARRRRRSGRRHFGGARRSGFTGRSGFIPAGALPVIAGVAGGVVLATYLGPQLFANQTWYASNKNAAMAATAALGFAGYWFLKRYNRGAALAVLGGSVGLPLAGVVIGALNKPPAAAAAGTKGLIDDGDTMRGMGNAGYSQEQM